MSAAAPAAPPAAPVKLFLHVCAKNNAERIVGEIIAAVHMSGLYRELAAAYIYICGDHATILAVVARIARSGAKWSIVKTAPGDTTYERLTLTDMHRHVAPGDHVLYLHSKGVTQCGTAKRPSPTGSTRCCTTSSAATASAASASPPASRPSA
jgi:hypothetical protein